MHLHVLTKRKFLRSGDHSHYDERELRTTPEERWKTGPQFLQGVFPAKLMRPIETQHSRAKLLKA